MKQLFKKPEALIFLFSFWVAATCNAGYWHIVTANNALENMPGAVFSAWMVLLTLGLISLIALVMAVGVATRVVLILLLFASASAGFFTGHFGVLVDHNMLINVFETNTAEAYELFSLPLITTVVLFGLLPAIVVLKYPLRRRRMLIAVRDRSFALLLALSMMAAPLYFAQKEIFSFGRNNRDARHAIAPINVVAASVVLTRGALRAQPQFEFVGLDAVHASATTIGDRPKVHVLILGETARAASFSLGGYERKTNPELENQANLLYLTADSCGTATATSLPCMLTQGGRVGFDRRLRRNQDNLLDIAARSGYDVYWLDNDNSCKGLCDRIDSRDVHLTAVDPFCSDDGCYDEILVHELKKLLGNITGDTLIVLHQLGSHGPAYFRRYPDQYRKFVPDCRSPSFGDCSNEEIVNAYDNTIVYTDHVIAAAIDALEAQSDLISPSLTYMSDHGESLGEHNLFLHGMPYKLAPDVQIQVPMILWFGGQLDQAVGRSSRCVQARGEREVSHDNLFHTELGLLDISTSAYDKEMDIYSGCRATGPLFAAGSN